MPGSGTPWFPEPGMVSRETPASQSRYRSDSKWAQHLDAAVSGGHYSCQPLITLGDATGTANLRHARC